MILLLVVKIAHTVDKNGLARKTYSKCSKSISLPYLTTGEVNCCVQLNSVREHQASTITHCTLVMHAFELDKCVDQMHFFKHSMNA
mgnify:CR=1 FL=1